MSKSAGAVSSPVEPVSASVVSAGVSLSNTMSLKSGREKLSSAASCSEDSATVAEVPSSAGTGVSKSAGAVSSSVVSGAIGKPSNKSSKASFTSISSGKSSIYSGSSSFTRGASSNPGSSKSGIVMLPVSKSGKKSVSAGENSVGSFCPELSGRLSSNASKGIDSGKSAGKASSAKPISSGIDVFLLSASVISERRKSGVAARSSAGRFTSFTVVLLDAPDSTSVTSAERTLLSSS